MQAALDPPVKPEDDKEREGLPAPCPPLIVAAQFIEKRGIPWSYKK